MRYGTVDDDELVTCLRRRDPKVWEQVYSDLYPRLRTFAVRRVGADLAADVVAETMAKAVGSIGSFDPNGVGLSAWIFGICRHVVADVFRAAAKDGRPITAASVQSGDVAERIESAEEEAAMRVAYAQLSPDDREILDLRVVAGLGADDVAGVLGMTSGAVRMAQSRALGRLRTQFKAVYS